MNRSTLMTALLAAALAGKELPTDHLDEKSDPNCKCPKCALRNEAMKSDSIDKIMKHAEYAGMLDAFNINMAKFGGSIQKEDVATVEEAAVTLEGMGYKESANLMRNYVSIARACNQYCLAAANESRVFCGKPAKEIPEEHQL